MDPIKVQGIIDWPAPTSVKDICFLGFCNFYQVFIPEFSKIVRPLNDLTKKRWPWSWSLVKQVTFQWLKDACASDLVLHTPDWTKQFILETDVSGYALGAVIIQEFDDNVHPIAFHSWRLQPAEKNYNTHDKELASVVFGFKCGWPYFLGAQLLIKVWTDHKNLQYFREPQKITSHQAQWIEFLQDFDYQLEHIPGSSNTIADLLSCCKDLNEGVNSETPRILLPDTLFHKTTHKLFLEDNKDKWQQVLC
jgi:hypothetical protein